MDYSAVSRVAKRFAQKCEVEYKIEEGMKR